LSLALQHRPDPGPAEDPAPGEAIRVRGLVQGVGFRPHVWRLATACGLAGEVWNDAEGVMVRIFGPAAARRSFRARLREEAPPLARIDALERRPLDEGPSQPGFRILASRAGSIRTGVVPDAATCPACLSELLDPDDRRHRYPFTNCAHCGPRLSIVRSIPYDRARTSMAGFAMCPACLAEYEDPKDRRFHAQPNACAVCGPRLRLEAATDDGDEIARTRRLLEAGAIVGVKGIGGFHLAVDATQDSAVMRLRERKRRFDKPFALMARDLAVVRRYCAVDDDERALLLSPAAPIVILAATGPQRVAPGVAPGQCTLGVMLPYTPLHHLLLEELDRPIVLTSGNLSEEPQCTGNEEARATLSALADHLLTHDRDIVNRVDDSVVRVMDGAPRLLRRARGYAPASLPLKQGLRDAPPLLAMGGELKSTFCLVKDGQATLSQHIGDLEDAATFADYQRNLDLYQRLLDHRPGIIAVDLHPEYLSTKLGRKVAEEAGLPVVAVQHHHAHIAACLAENDVPPGAGPVLGVALDGLGYGLDGTIWGGEFLLADYRGFKRLAHLRPVPMPGAAQAIREPWRNAYAQIRHAIGWQRFASEFADLELREDLERRPLATLDAMLAKTLNCPCSSSCGRLFDAVAAAVGICRERASYEGQAAILLEALVDGDALSAAGGGYPFALLVEQDQTVLDPAPMWPALLRDLADATPCPVIAARFHFGLADAIIDLVEALKAPAGFETVALSGGVFQTRLLFELVSAGLRGRGFAVLTHRRVPANDGGLALGQAAVALARLRPLPRTDQEVAQCV
jgi:hydrogenase maturation protein HypF